MFNTKRIKEWVRIIKFGKPSVIDWLKMGVVFIKLLFGKKCDRITWRRRMSKCYTCPIYDPVWKRCRPYTSSELGCGCYAPYSNMLGKECWGRKAYGDSFGWGKEDGK